MKVVKNVRIELIVQIYRELFGFYIKNMTKQEYKAWCARCKRNGALYTPTGGAFPLPSIDISLRYIGNCRKRLKVHPHHCQAVA